MKKVIMLICVAASCFAPAQAAEPSIENRVRVALALAQDAKAADLEPATAAWLDRLRASSAPAGKPTQVRPTATPTPTPTPVAVYQPAPVFYGPPVYTGPIYYSR